MVIIPGTCLASIFGEIAATAPIKLIYTTGFPGHTGEPEYRCNPKILFGTLRLYLVRRYQQAVPKKAFSSINLPFYYCCTRIDYRYTSSLQQSCRMPVQKGSTEYCCKELAVRYARHVCLLFNQLSCLLSKNNGCTHRQSASRE